MARQSDCETIRRQMVRCQTIRLQISDDETIKLGNYQTLHCQTMRLSYG